MIIWGSGGTLRTIGKMLNFNLTTLGIDITVGKSQIATDVNEQQITQHIQSHSGIISLLSILFSVSMDISILSPF